jgi:maleylacetoacetate isomerase
MQNNIKLYSYYRSSSAYRVRIALNVKMIPYEIIPIHLLKDGGEQYSDKYKKLNPSAQVPTLVDNEQIVAQSMAILEYLEEEFPKPSLMPHSSHEKAIVRQMCEIMHRGFESLEALLQKYSGKFSFGNQITLADCLLVPQVFSANRFKIDMAPFPKTMEIYKRCMELTDFIKASPEKQPDYQA